MSRAAQILTKAWHEKSFWLWLLWPLALLFHWLVWLRRGLFRQGWFRVEPSALPVIVVGNITVGGSGKSPLVAYLVSAFQAKGLTPGVVSRGYGASLTKGELREVDLDASPQTVGDEPLMLKQSLNCPVVICSDRARAVTRLKQLGCDIVISDDGLQHYRMARALELCVIDARRGFGNARMLPMGPLREPLTRLAQVDVVVLNGGEQSDRADLAAVLTRAGVRTETTVPMRLNATSLRRLDGSATIALAGSESARELLAHFANKELHAVAAIGHPERFFDTLHRLGLNCHPHSFADHHAFVPKDFDFLQRCAAPAAVIMTEKDAVKCRGLDLPDAWALRVEAHCEEDLPECLLALLAQKGFNIP